MELVGMGGAGMEVCAAQDGFAVGAVEEVSAAVREGGSGGFLPLSQRFGFTSASIHAGNCLIPIQPKYVLIPWSRLEKELLFCHIYT